MFSPVAAADLFTLRSKMGVIHPQEETAYKHIPLGTKQVSIRAAVFLPYSEALCPGAMYDFISPRSRTILTLKPI